MALRGSGSHDYFYGTAHDGDVLFPSNGTSVVLGIVPIISAPFAIYNLTRDIHCNRLVVGDLIPPFPYITKIATNGFKVFSKDLLFFGHGFIDNSGKIGSTTTTPVIGPTVGTVGGTGSSLGRNETAGAAGTTAPSIDFGFGGSGGAGATAYGSLAIGGAGGLAKQGVFATPSGSSTMYGTPYNFFTAISGYMSGNTPMTPSLTSVPTMSRVDGGAGGGQGGAALGGTGYGGDGGTGGGVLYVAARDIDFSLGEALGVKGLACHGGDGRGGEGVSLPDIGGAGGGGGGGVMILLFSRMRKGTGYIYSLSQITGAPGTRFEVQGGDGGDSGSGGGGTGGSGGRIILFGETLQGVIVGPAGVTGAS